jgi:hypothetical protein
MIMTCVKKQALQIFLHPLLRKSKWENTKKYSIKTSLSESKPQKVEHFKWIDLTPVRSAAKPEKSSH